MRLYSSGKVVVVVWGGGEVGETTKKELQKLGRFVVLETQWCDILHP